MAGFKYVVTNLLASPSTVAAEHENSSFPIANAFNQRPSKVYKSDTAFSADGTQTITIDLGGSVTAAPTMLFLGNHNLLEASHDVQVRSKATAFVGDDGDLIDSSGAGEVRAVDMYLSWAAPTARRYWRIVLTGSGSVVPKVGELVLGVSIQLTRQFNYSAVRSREFRNIQHTTTGGAVWSYEINDQRMFGISYARATESTKDEMETLFDATSGAHLPFVWVPEPDDPTTAIAQRCYYVRISDVLEYRDDYTTKDIARVTLTEMPREIAA